MSDFTFLSPTIVDRFVQIPDTLQVDARDNVITVHENTFQNYERYYRMNDFAIFCDIKKTTLFNSGMDWKYRMVDELNQPASYAYYRFIMQSSVYGDSFSLRQITLNGGAAVTEATSSAFANNNPVNAPGNAIDNNPSTSWLSGQTYRYMSRYGSSTFPWTATFTTDLSGVGYSGEWLQMQLPSAVVLDSYTFSARDTLWGAPVAWTLLGSNDGSGWRSLDTRSSYAFKVSRVPVSFSISNNTTAYQYYRVVVQQVTWGHSFDLVEWKVLARDASGNPTVAYPPAALTGASTTLSGSPVPSQNGTYVASASSNSANAVLAFDGNITTSWGSTAVYYRACQHSSERMNDLNIKDFVRTYDMYLNQYQGEWIQVRMATPAPLTSYALDPIVTTRIGMNCPESMVVLGSYDGINWRLVDQRTNVTWATASAQTFVPQYGQYAGIKVMDAHDPLAQIPVSLTQPILSMAATKNQLGTVTDQTRFVHYKQCGQFFKYSFKVGDPVRIPLLDTSGSPVLDPSNNQLTRTGQLYGVYLDSAFGTPLPYWVTVSGAGTDQAAENRLYYIADSTVLGASTLQGIAQGASGLLSSLSATLDASTQTLSVVAPPDPEFLEDRADASGGCKGGSLCVRKDASGNLVIRSVGERDASGNGLVQYGQSNFALFTADPSRALVLYWVVNPPARGTADNVYPCYMGEEMFVAWTSKALSTAAGGWRPVRDFFNPKTGQYERFPNLETRGANLELFKFTLNRDVPTSTVGVVRDSIRSGFSGLNLSGAAAKLHLPVAKYIVQNEKPTEPDVTTGDFFVPFAYSVMNQTDFQFDKRRSIMGGRMMQMICHYIFDAATNKEVAYFPYWLNESKQLTDKVIDALAALLHGTTTSAAFTRTDILRQIEIKYGRRYFDEYSVLNQVTNERIGSVWSVIQRIDELYLFFTVTVRTTVSQQAKDNAEVLRFMELPVVLRISD